MKVKQILPTENEEQASLFQWAAIHKRVHPALALLFAIPNGAVAGHGRFAIAAQLKKMGMKNGVPDVFLPVPRGKRHGLFIELKRRKGGVISGEQLVWLEALREMDYEAAIARGWEQARDIICCYLA